MTCKHCDHPRGAHKGRDGREGCSLHKKVGFLRTQKLCPCPGWKPKGLLDR